MINKNIYLFIYINIIYSFILTNNDTEFLFFIYFYINIFIYFKLNF